MRKTARVLERPNFSRSINAPKSKTEWPPKRLDKANSMLEGSSSGLAAYAPDNGTVPAIAGRKQDGRWPKGHSGNPAGKKPGTRNATTLAAQMLLEGEAEALMRKAVEKALDGDGDIAALRLCLERLIPICRSPIDLTVHRSGQCDLSQLSSEDLESLERMLTRALPVGTTEGQRNDQS